MSAKSGRNIVRALLLPTLIGVATAKKALVCDANTNITGLTLTNPTIIGATSTPVNAGASITLTTASPTTINLNTAAGSVVTLPAATGSGKSFRFFVTTTTTSGSHKILAASSADFLIGLAIGENAGTAKVFPSTAATNHSIQMPFTGTQPSGGFVGDFIEVVDIAANLWGTSMQYQAGTTPTTPYSSATS